MKSYNQELADAFTEIADLMAIIKENPFKIRAYREASRKLKEDLEPITKSMSKEELMEIPGIGDALAEKMVQHMQDGKMKYLEKLRKEIPKAVRELLQIPHLGPNRVRDLYVGLNIKSKKDLVKHAKNGDIEKLPGFGKKLVEQIMNAIETGQEKKKRHDRRDVEPIAQKMIKILEGVKGVSKVEVAGSYRRGNPTIGDIDILVQGSKTAIKKADQEIEKAFKVITNLARGETKIAYVVFPENLQVDIRFVPKESWGAALLYFTGSVDFNVMMRRVAIEKGWLLNEYGLFDGGEWIAGKTEEEVFNKLELPITEPKKR